MVQAFNARQLFVSKTNEGSGYSILWEEVDQPQYGEYQLWNHDSLDTVVVERETGVPGISVPPNGHIKFRMNRKQELRAYRHAASTGDGKVSLLVTDVSVSLPSFTLQGAE